MERLKDSFVQLSGNLHKYCGSCCLSFSINYYKKVKECSLMEDKRFTIAPDGVDPNLVPKRKLYTGADASYWTGNFGSDRFQGKETSLRL